MKKKVLWYYWWTVLETGMYLWHLVDLFIGV